MRLCRAALHPLTLRHYVRVHEPPDSPIKAYLYVENVFGAHAVTRGTCLSVTRYFCCIVFFFFVNQI